MPQPPSYTPTTDFSQQEANNASGRSTVNTAALDTELANIETTLDQTLSNLTLIQRDDGRLKDLACELHTLSPEVLSLMGGFNLRGLWLPATAYAVNDIASNAEYTYCCVTAHTSGGAFDGQYWVQFGFSGGADAAQAAAAAQVSANDAAASADDAADSATAASGSATTATTQAGNASTSAGNASTSAGNAATSETNAANSATAAQTAAANLPNATTAGADKFLQSNPTGTAWLYKTAAQVLAAIGAAAAGNVPVDTHAAASKATPVDADELPLADSAASFGLKKLPWANLKATLKTYFDTLYNSAQIITAPVPTFNAGAMTIPGVAMSLDFRSTTLGSGTVTRVSGTPASLVISSGSTLGTISAQQSDIVVLALNNAGTIELAAVNMAGGVNLDETGLISTTAEGGAGAADSATVVYSTTARTNVAYRVIGIIRSTQATAGTWATAPSLIQGAGGQALTAMSSIGYGQIPQSVTRTSGTTYYNTTGKPLFLIVTATSSGAGNFGVDFSINGVSMGRIAASGSASGAGIFAAGSAIIPSGMSYVLTNNNTTFQAYEIR